MFQSHPSRPPGDPSANGTFMMSATPTDPRVPPSSFRSVEQPFLPPGFAREHHLSPPIDSRPPNGMAKPYNPAESNLDGISALLKAKEIVDRRPQ